MNSSHPTIGSPSICPQSRKIKKLPKPKQRKRKPPKPKPDPIKNSKRNGAPSELDGKELAFCFYVRTFGAEHSQKSKVGQAVNDIMKMETTGSGVWKRMKNKLSENYEAERERYQNQDKSGMSFKVRYQIEINSNPEFSLMLIDLRESFQKFKENRNRRQSNCKTGLPKVLFTNEDLDPTESEPPDPLLNQIIESEAMSTHWTEEWPHSPGPLITLLKKI
jgi:hypothetical protein